MPRTQRGSGLSSPQDITTVFTNTADIWTVAITLAFPSLAAFVSILGLGGHTKTFKGFLVHPLYV